MRKFIVILLSTLAPLSAAWAEGGDTLRTVQMQEIVVRSARSLRDIGVQKSLINDAVLKENISASMAEVLAAGSSVFIKSSGRATLSTASMRGTAPSHTSVTWNGVELSSPMLGMTDFSMIPSYFVDGSEIYHGATSVNVTGGGIGGAVALSTKQQERKGLDLQYIQSLASFSTHDEYLRVSYNTERWGTSTRLLNSVSENDFPYINYDKVGHPLEYNKSCGYHDQHLLQEFFVRGSGGGRWSLKMWATDSSRGIPKLSVDFRDDNLTKSWQDELSLRTVAEWRRAFGGLRLAIAGGYNYDSLHYIHQFSKGGGEVQRAVDSRGLTHHTFATTSAEWSIGNDLMLAANLKAAFYSVDSKDVAPLVPVGFEAQRKELSSFLSARWKPTEWFGVATSLRDEWHNGESSPLIPALFLDATILPEWGLIVSSSVSRNYHHPSLGDLYFVPGGNPDLRAEEGITYDLGVESTVERGEWKVGGKVTLYGSDITDWILWSPTIKGFWTPENLARVKSRGVESKANFLWNFSPRGSVDVDAIFTYSSSINNVEGDKNFGNQLPYIPRYSASVSTGVTFGAWKMDFKWRYYSERFVSYSGTSFGGGSVPTYHVSDVALNRTFNLSGIKLKLRAEVLNLFNAVYQSVLSHPMPPRNYALSLEVRWGE